MTIMLELNAEEAAALQEIAEATGVTVEAVLHGLIAQVLPPAKPEQREAEDLEEDAERRREQEEVEANIKRWHAEAKS